MITYFLKRGNTFRVSSEAALDLHENLPVGTYVAKFDPMQGFFLEETSGFNVPSTIYGNTEKVASRILNTFSKRDSSTGVLLCGEQGSGKTLLAKLISNQARLGSIPTILVNSPLSGEEFNTFLATIQQPVIVLFDEFEKVYDADEQPRLLTMLDGVFGGKKLYIMTANDSYKINTHMKNRPGRFFYFMDFKGLEIDFITEYCDKNLNDKSLTQKVCSISTLFREFNFDMLQAMVEEINRYGEDPASVIDFLNVKPTLDASAQYTVEKLVVGGVVIEKEKYYDDGDWYGNPLGSTLSVYYETAPKDDEDDDSETKEINFTCSELVKYNGKAGICHFASAKGEVILKKKVQETMNYNKLLAL